MQKVIFIIFLVALRPQLIFPQQLTIEDTVPATVEVKDSTKHAFKHHSVKRACWQSAVIPGWGQVYNKKWWKVPIIYAGFGGLGFAIGWNTKRFRTYRDAYRTRVDGDTTTIDEFDGVYSDDNLIVLKNFYKRNMNLACIFTGVLYALNIIDAAVDAHLFEYDISDDLTLRVEPQMQFSSEAGKTVMGVNMSMRF